MCLSFVVLGGNSEGEDIIKGKSVLSRKYGVCLKM